MGPTHIFQIFKMSVNHLRITLMVAIIATMLSGVRAGKTHQNVTRRRATHDAAKAKSKFPDRDVEMQDRTVEYMEAIPNYDLAELTRLRQNAEKSDTRFG